MADNKPGLSKYAKKIRRRQAYAAKLGLPKGATWPEIWAAERAMRPARRVSDRDVK